MRLTVLNGTVESVADRDCAQSSRSRSTDFIISTFLGDCMVISAHPDIVNNRHRIKGDVQVWGYVAYERHGGVVDKEHPYLHGEKVVLMNKYRKIFGGTDEDSGK